MRKYLLVILAITTMAIHISAQALTLSPSGDNQKASVTQYIGNLVTVTVKYSSPDVHGPNGCRAHLDLIPTIMQLLPIICFRKTIILIKHWYGPKKQ